MSRSPAGKRIPHRRAGDTHPVDSDGGHALNVRAGFGLEPLEQRDIARALRAEAEIIPDEQPPHPEPLHQDVADECFRALARNRASKRQT